MVLTRRFTKPVVPEEQLDETVTDLLAYARDRGRAMRQQANRVDAPRLAPDVSSHIRESVRAVLEDEVVLTVKTADEGIEETELDHELTKKALALLKVKQLKEAARELGVAARGQAEDLAEAIASHYQWDEQQIALFILRNLDEPNEATSHLSRVFALSSTELDPLETEKKLTEVTGRYIRTDVAKWFVFHTVQPVSESAFSIDGSYMSYTVGIDELGGSPELTPSRSIKKVHAVIDIKSMWVRVDNAPMQAARTAVKAIASIAGAGVLGYVPNTSKTETSEANVLNETAEFFLDLLYNRLPSIGVENINLTLVRFQMTNDGTNSSIDGNKPSLKQIRFEGSHLLDSVAACRILAKDRRPIANIAMRMSYKRPDEDFGQTYPMSLALDSDHFTVTTGVGVGGSTGSVELHKSTLRLITDEMRVGVADREKLDGLANNIRARAEQENDPDTADMLNVVDPADDAKP